MTCRPEEAGSDAPSGGVAAARASIRAVDAQTRTVLQGELLRIWEANRKTVVYITHSIDEAALLGDRVVLMTAHPGTNKATFPVDIPRPRTLASTHQADFNALTQQIWAALQDEVMQAMREQLGEVQPVDGEP